VSEALTPWWLRPFGSNDEPEPTPEPTPEPDSSSPPPSPERAEVPSHEPIPVEAVAEDAEGAATAEGADGEDGTGRGRGRRRRGSRGRGKNGKAEEGDKTEDVVEAVADAPPAPAVTEVKETREPREPKEATRAPREAREPREARPARRQARPAAPAFEDDFASFTAPAPREVLVSVAPERSGSIEERKIALFCDLENIALGVRDSNEVKKFDIGLVLERLLEKGKIIVKKAYCDWERYSEFKRPFHEAAIELIDIPQKYYSGKNSADIKMVVDAMDLCYSKEHLDTFVIMSGDSDFSPLVSKLKENNKYVIGVGVKGASSNLLIYNCDEFIYYEDIWRDQQRGPQLDGLSKKNGEVFALMIDAIQALVRESKDVLWGSMVKQTMQRKKPSFNEGYYGYSTFSELLEDAERKSIIRLKKDQRSGSYVVTGFANSNSGARR
jgi:uncharacterized protein (TIGR00288 family)